MFSGSINKNSLSIPLKIKTETETIETHALLDSGAGGKFIDQNYAKTLGQPLKNLEKPIPAIRSIWTTANNPIVSNWIRKTKNLIGLSLVTKK